MSWLGWFRGRGRCFLSGRYLVKVLISFGKKKLVCWCSKGGLDECTRWACWYRVARLAAPGLGQGEVKLLLAVAVPACV